MSETSETTITGFKCDRCGVHRPMRPTPYFPGRTRAENLALDEGWHIFVSRGRRWYCPDCYRAGYPRNRDRYEVQLKPMRRI